VLHRRRTTTVLYALNIGHCSRDVREGVLAGTEPATSNPEGRAWVDTHRRAEVHTGRPCPGVLRFQPDRPPIWRNKFRWYPALAIAYLEGNVVA